jgi:hypothetical protein
LFCRSSELFGIALLLLPAGDADAYGTIADCYTDLDEFEKAAAYYDKYIQVGRVLQLVTAAAGCFRSFWHTAIVCSEVTQPRSTWAAAYYNNFIQVSVFCSWFL